MGIAIYIDLVTGRIFYFGVYLVYLGFTLILFLLTVTCLLLRCCCRLQLYNWLLQCCCSTASNTVSTGSSEAPKSNLWLESINSPLIQDSGDSKLLKLRFDVSQYQPEEIVVKTVDNKLLVSHLRYTLIATCTNVLTHVEYIAHPRCHCAEAIMWN